MNQKQKEQQQPSSAKKRLAVFILLSFLLLGGGLFFAAYQYLSTPVADPGQEKIISIPKGLSFDKIARQLQRENIIKNIWKFKLLARIKNQASQVQAGEFKLNSNWTPQRILQTLTQGRAVLYKLSIPEGLTWWETANLVQQSGLATYSGFAAAIRDKDLLRKYNIPASTAEGYLFPETYHLPKPEHKDARPIVTALLQEFWRQTRQSIWPDGAFDPKRSHRLVTLASLVEKETSVDKERARIAGVFINRLQKGMRLQCDPTIIYGLGRDFDGNLTKKDLQDSENLYNTYRHAGLPPGPICSPGLDSLKAASNPEQHDYLYFVSKGDGSHHFSKTLTEHNRAVRKYQLGR